MASKISLTGIKPSGTPHIGNYLGAIKPALELCEIYDARYFIADYHALNTVRSPERLRSLTYEVAASWLACGLNPEQVIFYRQSDIPEVMELATMLMCFTSKGRLNGAHAYKAAIEKNTSMGKDPDRGINMGLFSYPVLMAADILLYDADLVPIGKDQIQHLEITADIAEAVNRNYAKPLLNIPSPLYAKETMVIPGLDGNKMSKSHDNVIPLFCPPKQLRRTIMQIVTNSQTIDEPKDPDKCIIFTLYKFFATEEEQNFLARRYRAGGMGWGHAKEELYRVIHREINNLQEKYETILNDRSEIDQILSAGRVKARGIASEKIKLLRREMGF